MFVWLALVKRERGKRGERGKIEEVERGGRKRRERGERDRRNKFIPIIVYRICRKSEVCRKLKP